MNFSRSAAGATSRVSSFLKKMCIINTFLKSLSEVDSYFSAVTLYFTNHLYFIYYEIKSRCYTALHAATTRAPDTPA